MTFKIITLIVLVALFAYSTWLNYLRMKSADFAIPENVADVYDEESYKKWKAYDNEQNKLNLYSSIVSSVVSFLLIAFNVYALVAGLFPNVNLHWGAIIVFVFDMVVGIIIDLPFSYYHTFSIEERYGFNKSTKKLFAIDLIKSLIIQVVLVSSLLSIFITLHQSLGSMIIVAFSAVLCAFLLILFAFNPIFQKIFNKFTLLEDGSLKDSLTKLMEDNGCKVKAIKVVDGSKRSSKANAYFTGIGALKTIVLYDTLIELMTEEEIIAVFAHEMGHNKHKDVIKGYCSSIVTILLIVVGAYLLVSYPEIYTQFGFNGLNYGMAYILLGVFISVVNPVMGLITSYFSCKHEYAADKFAVENGYGANLVTALKKLSKDSLVNLSPHPIVVKLTYSHPPMSERIAAIEKAMGK